MSTFVELGKMLGVDNFSLHVIDEIDNVDELLKGNISNKQRSELNTTKSDLLKIRDYYMNWLKTNKN